MYGAEFQAPDALALHQQVHAQRFGQGYVDPVANSFTEEQRTMIQYAATSTLPIAGVTSGMISSGMNFDCLPANSVVNGTTLAVSPLQQWILPRPEKTSGPLGFEVGSPVQIIHLTSPDAGRYNDLIGDVVAVNRFENADGTAELLFDVRCAIAPEELEFPARFVRDQGVFGTKLSHISHSAAAYNCMKMFNCTPQAMQQRGDYCPPVVLITGLPSEKLEPLGTGYVRAAEDGTHTRPPLVRPPVWGQPCPPVVVGPDGKPLQQGTPGGCTPANSIPVSARSQPPTASAPAVASMEPAGASMPRAMVSFAQ